MELITINRQVRSKAERIARCSTGNKTKTQERTALPVADGFLRHRFSPVMEAMPEQLENKEVVERDFFKSLSHLQKLYGFEVELNNDLIYPCNIASAWMEATYYMGAIAPKINMAIMHCEAEGATIITYEGYNTGSCLYYIPLSPLWELLRCSDSKPLADLLLSLYAYLYQSVAIPDYTRDDYHLYYTYLSIAEWYNTDDEMEKETLMELKAAIRLAKRGGKSIVSKINKPRHLKAFGKRLMAFHPRNEKERQLKGVAQSFYDLSLQYPHRSIGERIWIGLEEPDEEQRIMPDQYLSFIWDNNDILSDDLMEYVNNELSEIAVMDEPLALQFFDRPQDRPCHDLTFEAMLFPLLKDLIYMLNNL